MTEKNDLATQAKQALNDSTQALPEHVQNKLAAARKKALLAHQTKQHVKATGITWTKEFVALAACVCLIVPIWLGVSTLQTKELLEPQGLELMISFVELNDDEWELVDDLEFALWLNEQPNQADKIEPS